LGCWCCCCCCCVHYRILAALTAGTFTFRVHLSILGYLRCAALGCYSLRPNNTLCRTSGGGGGFF
jgi:hypothetical protein